ncbi:uncharacterized protein LOC133295270 [Gastrolobium bilobum]|uniref:uncharacterized protein LOC133295270 n=1 Tax=Gastrolobium bilobum TaxID=150636 RepID=UPI002AB0D0EB|nr:uncharacterized protein LOC133295270 [Gastrolobium bilobum]
MKEKEAFNQDKAKAMIFLCHHLHEGLKAEYLTVKDPLELWNNLKERYDQQKTIILPKARYDWMHLRLQDFKSVSEYNSAIFKISSQLKVCGENITNEDLLEKTFSTFHAPNVLLQQQYREKGFKKYSELISCLIVAEQNNELLMKNHEARPTGSAPFPKVNVANHNNFEIRQNYSRSRGHGRGCGRGRGNGPNIYQHHYGNKQENKGPQSNSSRGKDNICHRCGMKGITPRNSKTHNYG